MFKQYDLALPMWIPNSKLGWIIVGIIAFLIYWYVLPNIIFRVTEH